MVNEEKDSKPERQDTRGIHVLRIIMACWDLNFTESDIWKYRRDTRGLMTGGHARIVGNIYENPELLKIN